ncbi:related to HIS2 - histidinol-phosphatase [Ustilago trichophora]|uniref:Histidinol-phosphatase n=1 Tax=Ustilago trichophora TaxID=86804 RepID=A0A5C3EPX3_9BASI|nr:related to HIS2 - histidinol-phosphatase [Ustilago trichophora]
MPHSHHSHSGQFCSHAKDTLSQVLQRAQSLGFTHFHLSEHVPRQNTSELYPEELEANLTPQTLRITFGDYLTEARRLQKQHKESLHILVGCESENITSPGTLDYLTEVLGSDRNSEPGLIGKGVVDYIVGSLHHTHSIPIDFDRETFDRSIASFEKDSTTNKLTNAHLRLVDQYLDDQMEVMQRLKPEVIGHFDLFRLFTPELKLKASQVWSKVERNISFAVEYGALFECNAAAFRKGWNTSYPAKEILDLILSMGGRLCLSDDSHGVQAVGLNYLRMRQYLIDSGVDRIWYLEKNSSTSFSTIGDSSVTHSSSAPTRFPRGTVAKSMGPEWKTHPFWTTFAAALEGQQ